MNRNITFLAYVLTLTFLFQEAKAQTAGDYRSNLTSGNLWSNFANWEVYNGASWVAASQPPTSADGVITITAGDSVALTGSSITIDQVVVSATANLTIFTGTFTLNDKAGEDDIIVDGRLRLGTNTGILNGAGSILVNSSGQFYVRNSGHLQVASTVNNGYTETDANASIEVGTFTNNLTFNWTGTTNTSVLLNSNAVFDNNGTFQILGTGTRSINSGTSNGTFNNNATGIINNSGGNSFSVFSAVTFKNLGNIQGIGVNNFATVAAASGGSISPGGASGAGLTVNGPLISAKPATINIQLLTTPGPGNDTLYVTSAGDVDLSSAILTVTDNDPATAIATYTIMKIPSGVAKFTGAFATTNKPSNYGAPQISADGQSVTIAKLYPLPLTWGSFTARQNDGKVMLNWTTLQESNVSRFVVEHSTDGLKYNAIGTIAAAGNSNQTLSYSFQHSNPQYNGRNFYRIVEIDLDGQSAYSIVRSVKLGDNSNGAIAIRSNPVQNGSLSLESDITNASAFITGINGTVIKDIRLHQGINTINVIGLAAGVYTINVFDNKSRIFSGKFVKR